MQRTSPEASNIDSGLTVRTEGGDEITVPSAPRWCRGTSLIKPFVDLFESNKYKKKKLRIDVQNCGFPLKYITDAKTVNHGNM